MTTYRRICLPSYAASRHGATVPCVDCGAPTPKLAKNTRRCPEHQAAFARAYRARWKERRTTEC